MSAFTNISESTLRQWGFPEGPIDISYPFEDYGDNKSIIVKRDYLVDARYRLSMPLDTDIDAETAALVKVEFDRLILVSQTSAGEDCGLARVTRTFATIPQDHIERGAQNVQLYGLSMQAGAWQQAWVSSSKYGGYYYFNGLPAEWRGSSVLLSFYIGDYGSTMRFWAYCTADGVCRIKESDAPRWGIYTIPQYLNAYWRKDKSRAARMATVDGFIRYSYRLLSTPDTPLILPQKFTPFWRNDPGSAATSDITILSSTTVPTAVEYLAMVDAREVYQYAEATVSKWQGNIYEIAAPYVFAV